MSNATLPVVGRCCSGKIYIYNEMTGNKLEAVKEKILIRYLGLGIKEAYHPWSKGEHMYTADELLDHLINTIIPLESELKQQKKFQLKRR